MAKLARAYKSRLMAYPPSEVPTLLATSAELVIQIGRRLAQSPELTAASALRYAEPVIAVLEAGKA
jgi:hypothetical protein